MTKKTFAKVAGWLASALFILGTSGTFGKYSNVMKDIAIALGTGLGVHVASDTSAGHPNGG